MGQCGPSCQMDLPGTCSNWSLNCLRHDVCSYYYDSSGGLFDPSCGHAWMKASHDFSVPCLTDQRCQLEGFNTQAQVCSADSQPARFARYADEGQDIGKFV